ncbi:protein phosphatase 2C domain-containing protein [Nitrospira sp. Nam80]
MMQWKGLGTSHQGFARPTNQDAFFINADLQLWAVADGMGGHPGGDVASRLVVDTLAEEAVRKAALLQQHPPEQVEPVLRGMVEAAHQAILDHTSRHPELAGMGTTLTLLHISSGPCSVATIVNEGDSRAYLLRGRTLKQLTRDHSMVEEYIRQGLLSTAQALRHPQRHVLSRAVGLGPQSDVDVVIQPLEPSDVILLCTDGLTKMIEDARIESAMNTFPVELEALCGSLLAAALDAGGIDNITAVVISRRPEHGGKIH